MLILGIETSCDETSAAVVKAENGRLQVLSNVVFSQIDIHKQYGGVIPEVAAREHVVKMVPVLDQALKQAGLNRDRARQKLDAIAVVNGPGLITSLMVGVETAKSLAFAWGVPLVAVNHIEAHIYAAFLANPDIKFPAVVLTVSGGHTQLVLMHGHGQYEALGETRDDAAGEAFDKAAKLMGLGYPGGPSVSKQAKEFKAKDRIIRLPRPMLESRDYDFSFSGLKTALLYAIKNDSAWQDKINEYCYEFQEAVIDVLVAKTLRAAKEKGARSLVLTGGVSANQGLRQKMSEQLRASGLAARLCQPDLEYTTDNAAMAAAAGYFRANKQKFTGWDQLKVDIDSKLMYNK